MKIFPMIGEADGEEAAREARGLLVADSHCLGAILWEGDMNVLRKATDLQDRKVEVNQSRINRRRILQTQRAPPTVIRMAI